MVHVDVEDKILEVAENISKGTMNNYINRILEIAIEQENIIGKEVYVSIESKSRKEIRVLNKKYRNIDKETDVLSFPIFTKEELLETKFEQIELGDIVICLDVVKQQSIEYETGMKRELLYMITHGVCHLLGYDHEIAEEKKVMRKKEEDILNMLEG